MEKLETVCIRCPVGCHLVVEQNGEEVVVSGNRCPRGSEYGKQEMICPKRTITTVYHLKKGGTLSVRTKGAVDKKLYFDVLKAIKSAPEPKNLKAGECLLKNVLNTNIDVVITSVNKNED